MVETVLIAIASTIALKKRTKVQNSVGDQYLDYFDDHLLKVIMKPLLILMTGELER